MEEQLRERGTGEQVFVAMWFDKSLDEAYKEGFEKGIKEAGYDPKRTDDDTHHSDKLDDRVLADIRQSRIVVADFTCEEFIRAGHTECEGRPNGNVHYEAGFAHGLGRPVIYTCRTLARTICASTPARSITFSGGMQPIWPANSRSASKVSSDMARHRMSQMPDWL